MAILLHTIAIANTANKFDSLHCLRYFRPNISVPSSIKRRIESSRRNAAFFSDDNVTLDGFLFRTKFSFRFCDLSSIYTLKECIWFYSHFWEWEDSSYIHFDIERETHCCSMLLKHFFRMRLTEFVFCSMCVKSMQRKWIENRIVFVHTNRSMKNSLQQNNNRILCLSTKWHELCEAWWGCLKSTHNKQHWIWIKSTVTIGLHESRIKFRKSYKWQQPREQQLFKYIIQFIWLMHAAVSVVTAKFLLVRCPAIANNTVLLLI